MERSDIWECCGFIIYGRQKYIKYYISFFILLGSLALKSADLSVKHTDQNPLFELGIFLAHFSTPDYPASEQTRIRTIPAPLAYYHGEILRSDDQDGTRFRFINVEKFDLDFSFGGSFPTDSGNNQARLGMPELDWTFEIGPRLLYYIYRNKSLAQVRVGLPLRASFATNFASWNGLGYIFAPTFQIDLYNSFMIDNLNLYFIVTPTYLNQGLAAYFYQVDNRYQTSARPAYDAKAGFLGTELSLAIKYSWAHKSIVVGTQYADFSQSANSQAYLHRRNITWSFLVAFGWILFETEARGVK